MRLRREFVGTTSTVASFDPEEFVGMSVPQVTEEILKCLADIDPKANYFVDDIVEAANEIVESAGRGT